MSGARPTYGPVTSFCLCVVAASLSVGLTFIVTTDESAGRFAGGAVLALLAAPIVAIAGMVAVVLERQLFATLSPLPYIVLSAVIAGGAGWLAERILIPSSYDPDGAFVAPAIVAGLTAATLWHILVRKRKVLTHG